MSINLTPTTLSEARRSRLHFIDHLRAALAILVVLHHVALVYGASAPFYYSEPPFASPRAFLGFMVFVLANQAWFMGAFFLLAGYFVQSSYDRKGAGAFISDRLVRLGLPVLFFIFILSPLSSVGFYLMPPELTGITTPLSWDAYTHLIGLGPLWFALLLLVFCLGYAAIRWLTRGRSAAAPREGAPPTYLGVGLFALVLAGASYLMRMVVPIGKEVLDFPTLAYLPQYLSFFVVGIVASRRDWFRTVPASMGVVGLVGAVVASVVLFPLAFTGSFFSLELSPALDNAMGNGHWQSAAYALWDSITVVGLCLALIPFFRRFLGRRSALGAFLSRQSFGVYALHIPVIVFIAYALRGLQLPPLAKFGLVSVIVLPVCFGLSYLTGKVPGLALALGGGGSRSRRRSGGAEIDLSADEDGTLIAIDGLVKTYSDVTAVNGLTLDIKKGELFGLLGPNGAGKTTTISVLCGLKDATSGTITYGGIDVSSDMPAIKTQIGVCPQEAAVYEFLTGRENVELFGTLHGLDRATVRARAGSLLSETGLEEAANRKAKGYSGGMTRQLNLLMALISDPEIVFLDEPTVGMDARARRRTWEYIASLKEQGKTVILTTHYIEEAESLSDRVGIIDYGELVALGTPDELMTKHAAKDLEEVFLKITGRRIAECS